MARLKIHARKLETTHVTDHAGRPARLLWSRKPTEVLLPLASICFYFVHPDLNLDTFDFNKFRSDVLQDTDEKYEFRVDIFFIPGGTAADCIEHYRKELKYRGDVLEQIREVQEAYNDFYNNHRYVHEERKARLPGLFASHRGDNTGYHGLVFSFKEATWDLKEDDTKLDMIQFDPGVTLDDLEPRQRIPLLAPIETTRVRARSKSFALEEVPEYRGSEDQGVWCWFSDLRCGRLWDGALKAGTLATFLGWTSW